jgi:peroxiredoxin (alkyl hydroperoxide reductase subunit C)
MTEQSSIPTINSPAPEFEANSTHGPISLGKYTGKWVVLFSHPYDFTPVCSTEFLGFATRAEEFAKRNVQLIGLSVDSVFSHIAWTRSLEKDHGVKIPFPVIADLDTKVARAYGMIHPGASDMATVRAVFVIDPKKTIRALVYYPMTCGRSIDEILRIVDALQAVDAAPSSAPIATPEGWRKGDKVIMPPPKTSADAEARAAEHVGKNPDAKDWYFVKRPQ